MLGRRFSTCRAILQTWPDFTVLLRDGDADVVEFPRYEFPVLFFPTSLTFQASDANPTRIRRRYG
jgi:hypothetical protein